jgi:hypothetical protein
MQTDNGRGAHVTYSPIQVSAKSLEHKQQKQSAEWPPSQLGAYPNHNLEQYYFGPLLSALTEGPLQQSFLAMHLLLSVRLL